MGTKHLIAKHLAESGYIRSSIPSDPAFQSGNRAR